MRLLALALPLVAACAAPPGGELVRLHGGSLYLHATRVGSGEEVLLVPEESLLGADFGPLVSKERELIFYDPRGRGRSDAVGGPDWLGVGADVADIEDLRKALGVDRMSLLGWSYYANVCALYAVRYPHRVDKLILVSPAPLAREPHWVATERKLAERADPQAWDKVEAMAASAERAEDPVAFCRAFSEASLAAYVVDPACLEDMRSDPCVFPNIDPERLAEEAALAHASLWEIDWRAELGALAAPTLIVHGDRGAIPLAASLEWHAALPDADLILFEEVGQIPWLEAPERFFPTVESFLGGELGPR